jgi:hypothetical protein
VLAAALYFGSTASVLLALLPVVHDAPDPATKRRLFARVMRTYNPLTIGALGVALVTGASNLTDYKAALGGGFAPALGVVLLWKLVGAFLLILLATSLSFGIGHRTVREELGDLPVDAVELDRRLDRLRKMLWAALVLAAIVIGLGLEMSH